MTGARVRLTFPADMVREPVVARMAQRFGVTPNIRRADVGEDVGWIVLEVDGPAEAVTAALAWAEEVGVEVSRLADPLEG